MKRENNRWTAPEVVPFSGNYSDADPCFSPDGKRLFFVSRRPLDGTGEPKDWDIWYVDRTGDGWSEPENVGTPVNTDKDEFHPSVTNNGTLYYMGFDADEKSDIYRSRFKNGRYLNPEKLGKSINTDEYGEGEVYIAPDESYMIFNSNNRPDSYGRSDFYITYRNEDGSWTKAKNMGEKINSSEPDYCPNVTFDGKYFFFTSFRRPERAFPDKPAIYKEIIKIYESPLNGRGNIYWIDAKIIRMLRDK